MAAGTYNTRLSRLTPTVTTDSTTGQEKEVHAHSNYLWCSVQETSGRRNQDGGAIQTGATVTILVRQYPTLSVKDLLKDEAEDIVYQIDTIIVGDNQLEVEAYRNDTLEDFTIEEDS